MAAGPAPWWWPVPAWLPGSTAAWFVVVNVVVCAIAVLSSRARESLSPRLRGGGGGGAALARRASSALERVRSSFSLFSFTSASFYAFQPDADADATAQPQTPTPRKRSVIAPDTPPAAEPQTSPAPPRKRLVAAPAPDTPPARPEAQDNDEDEDANAMSMDEAYALVMAARQRPAPTEEEVSRGEVDAKAEEFVAGFKDEQRRQRLDSIFNYTQMLKQRAAAFAAGRRQQPAAQL
ncbi:pathogen-associated molecular patterns-induced protein A70-like [Oryza brachyantha]|uniref:pathogen-associated molecular patterns-induced protein A70-like n=1 Tax=Oryza brachyantha TaxID=4533 RepID=UPI001ADBAB0F|nr:pathogen-associated molecular patterns-induced protein A70-like [Oryza brachyantha]